MIHAGRHHDTTALALGMLEWLARDVARLERFMALTGYTPDSLKHDATSEALHLAVLEHLMQDELLLLQFCADTGTRPEDCAAAWQRLRAAEHGEYE